MTAIDLPAMFTPNGDGQDDVLTCLLPVPGEVEFTVYDRWGQVMFRTTDPAIRWNGETNGVAAPPGMYFYQLMLAGNNPVEQKGNVLLLR
ncbi:MAG: gliding motility-associated C-terminal domain-containing protein [Saprospiraceae bacterium]|nr:gliding motility-associated C-terminal domain-containing protein [Saprospiraceae bacterium]